MGKFVVNETKTGYTFHLKAGNGETIAVSEVYNTEAACRNGADSVKRNAPVAEVEDQTAEGNTAVKHPSLKFIQIRLGNSGFG